MTRYGHFVVPCARAIKCGLFLRNYFEIGDIKVCKSIKLMTIIASPQSIQGFLEILKNLASVASFATLARDKLGINTLKLWNYNTLLAPIVLPRYKIPRN